MASSRPGAIAGPVNALFMSPLVEQEFVKIIAQIRKDDLAIVAELLQAGAITPVIDRHYMLSDVADASRYSVERHVRGKLVVKND